MDALGKSTKNIFFKNLLQFIRLVKFIFNSLKLIDVSKFKPADKIVNPERSVEEVKSRETKFAQDIQINSRGC